MGDGDEKGRGVVGEGEEREGGGRTVTRGGKGERGILVIVI